MFLGLYRKIKNSSVALVSIAIVLSVASCLPVNEEKINTELFENKDDLKTLAEKLKPGMREEDVLAQINIPIEMFSYMNTDELQRTVYGNSVVQGSPFQLERFKRKLLTYKGYYLPYKDIESTGSLGLGKMKINKTGHDLRFTLVFEDGVLLKASVEGSPNIDVNEDRYMWNSLLEKGTGVGF